MKKIFHTPDRDFRCFNPSDIILSHMPVSARGKDKKTNSRTSAARWPQVDRDVILMLKIRHDVTSQRIQDFLDIFFMFYNFKWGI